MAETRLARVEWIGGLRQGRGTVSAETTATFKDLQVTWLARAEHPVEGVTSPEELMAAAHGSCFAMALAGELARRGARSERLDVRCAVTFDKTKEGHSVTTSELDVHGEVHGMDPDHFQAAAEEVGRTCPMSRALKGVAIHVRSYLAGELEPPQPGITQ